MKTFEQFMLAKEGVVESLDASANNMPIDRLLGKVKVDIDHLSDVVKTKQLSDQERMKSLQIIDKLRALESSFDNLYKSFLNFSNLKDPKNSVTFKQAKTDFLTKLHNAMATDDPQHASGIMQQINQAMERPDANMNEVFGNVIRTIQALVKHAEEMLKNSNV